MIRTSRFFFHRGISLGNSYDGGWLGCGNVGLRKGFERLIGRANLVLWRSLGDDRSSLNLQLHQVGGVRMTRHH
jgi:hypothetical protein